MSWVCLIGPSSHGARAVRALGRPLVVVTAGAVPQGVVPQAVVAADITDADAVGAAIEPTVAELGPPELVVSFTESAQLTERFGLPGVTPAAVRVTRDKARMRQALDGTPASWPWHAGTPEEIRGRLTDGSWIVKPVDGTATEGLFVAHSPEDLDRWTARDGRWIAEPLAGGPEFSVEAVSHAGTHDVLAITAKRTTGAFVECGHVVPAPIPDEQRDALGRHTRLVLDTLGIHDGASHTELRWDPEHGPVLIETHTRPGSDFIPELVALATGQDQYVLALAGLLGVSPPVPHPTASSCPRPSPPRSPRPGARTTALATSSRWARIPPKPNTTPTLSCHQLSFG